MKTTLLSGLLILTFIGLSQKSNAQCIGDTNNIYTFFYNGDKYEIVKENLNWTNAAACAKSRGGFLAEIDSQDEQDTIFMNVNNAGITASNTVAPDGGGASYLWLGGNDLVTEGKWIWDGDNDSNSVQFWQGTKTGSSVGGLYNNWGNEPDDFNGQDALGLAFTNWPLGVAGQWNDVDDGNNLYYIIEYDLNTIGLNESLIYPTLEIYPNPNSGIFTIEIGNVDTENLELNIYNVMGDIVLQKKLYGTKKSVDVSELTNGVYFISYKSNSGVSTRVKIVIDK